MSVDGLTFASRDHGTIAGVVHDFSSPDPTPARPLAQYLGPLTVRVAIGAAVTLWGSTVSPLTRFDYFKIRAGAAPTVDALAGLGTAPVLAGELELTCQNPNVTEQLFVVQLVAFLEFPLHSDIARYGMAAGTDGFLGTAGVINQLRYKNTTGAVIAVTFALGAV